MGNLKAALDVHYDEDRQIGRAAAVVFAEWTEAYPTSTRVREHHGIEAYVSGQFFRRELPCLLPLIEVLQREAPLDTIIVDGHVDLGIGRPGLGRHLCDSLGGELEIIGVAKKSFKGALSEPVCRGRSKRPLWVSSTRSTPSAASNVLAMHGKDRLPTLLRLADHLARGYQDPEGNNAVD